MTNLNEPFRQITYLLVIALSALLGAGGYKMFFAKENDEVSNCEGSFEKTECEEEQKDWEEEYKQCQEFSGELVEIEDPGFELPASIHQAQIQKYFQIGDTYFALVLENSLNIPLLDLPEDFEVSFRGVLYNANNDEEWREYIKIMDVDSQKNNPYYLWSECGKLYLSIIDHNGAGSGEGVNKIFVSTDGIDWQLDSCNYFGSSSEDYLKEVMGLTGEQSDITTCENDAILEISIVDQPLISDL